jgi:hypothetical protein
LVGVAFGSLSVAFSSLSVILAALNDYSVRYFLDYLGSAVLVISFAVLGMLVASRRPDNPLGWIYLAVGFWLGLVAFAWPYAEYALVTDPGSSLPGGPLMSWLGAWAWIPGALLLTTFALLLFPDGRLPSPRWRPVAWFSALPLLIVVSNAIWLWPYRGRALVEQPGRFKPGALLDALLDLLVPFMLVCGMACVASLGVRFWRSRGIERQQIKWFLYAATVALTLIAVTTYLSEPIVDLLSLLATLSLPVAVGIAIFKHQLYDIDVLINRTLVYGSLTVTLVLLYFGGIVVLQRLFVLLIGERSTLAVVASTLAIAALFNPLHRRVQGFVDRRFYRRKYDAVKTLAAFNVRLREETQLETLSGDVVEVVRETMQPAHVSMWLKPARTVERTEEGVR